MSPNQRRLGILPPSLSEDDAHPAGALASTGPRGGRASASAGRGGFHLHQPGSGGQGAAGGSLRHRRGVLGARAPFCLGARAPETGCLPGRQHPVHTQEPLSERRKGSWGRELRSELPRPQAGRQGPRDPVHVETPRPGDTPALLCPVDLLLGLAAAGAPAHSTQPLAQTDSQ